MLEVEMVVGAMGGDKPPRFGMLLKEYRIRAGLTQEELADRAQLSTRAISDLERGINRRPRKQTAILLAAALGLSDELRTVFESAVRESGASAWPESLPAEPNPLVGREEDIAVAASMLRRAEVRLLVLTGPGGVGKTRLGIRVASELSPEFPDGIFFVSLAEVREADLVAYAIAGALSLRESGERELRDALHEHLKSKRCLLVLDNFEHLDAAAPLVAWLLRGSSDLKVLVTSRSLLRLQGEHGFSVVPLALPERVPSGDIGDLMGYASVALFVERARMTRPEWSVTEENASAVAALCRQLDGLPLAIELAAARLKLMSPSALLERVDRALDILAGGPQDLPARQRALRATLDWSYALLTEDARRLFRRASVFVGGFALEAAEQVCGEVPEGPIDVLEALGSLVDNSLVRADDDSGEVRFVMLETVRAYALERLEESGEREAALDRLTDYVVGFAQRAVDKLTGSSQGEWLDTLDAENPNIRAAFDWLIRSNRGDRALRLGAGLWRFWYLRGYLSEGRRWLSAALDLEEEEEGPAADRAGALYGAGVLTYLQGGDHAKAVMLFKSALSVYRDAGDDGGVANCLNNLGMVARYQGDGGQATRMHEEALSIAQRVGSKRAIAVSLEGLGSVEAMRGDSHRARALLQRSMDLFAELGDDRNVADLLRSLANVALSDGDLGGARLLSQDSLTRFSNLKDKTGMIESLTTLGEVNVLEDLEGAAADTFEEALRLSREIGDLWNTATSLQRVGDIALRRSDHAGAMRMFEEALWLNRKTAYKEGVATALVGLGRALQGVGELRQAARSFCEVLESGAAVGAVASSLEGLAQIAEASGDRQAAVRLRGAALGEAASTAAAAATSATDSVEGVIDLARRVESRAG